MIDRTPDAVLGLISGVDVAHNAAFQPRDGLTFCNCLVTVYTAALGCPVPPALANDQVSYLDSNEGRMAGWNECAASTALLRASLGYPVVVGMQEQPHGHVALMVPSPVADPGRAYVSAAGAECFIRTRLEKSFGLKVVRYFTHN